MPPFHPTKSALLVVDMQNDFCPPTGSLAVPQGRDIILQINSLLTLPFAVKAASRDWHPTDHISFVTSHPGKNTFDQVSTTHPAVPGKHLEQVLWPVHCVQGTEGAEFVEGLELEGVELIIEKGQEKLVESYSAFTDPWGLFPSKLEELLKEKGITHLFVVGLAEDYCVKSSSVDAARIGFRTVIVGDCTKGVAPESTEAARKELKEEGVEYMSSSEVKKLFSKGNGEVKELQI